jgi:archaeosine synthase
MGIDFFDSIAAIHAARDKVLLFPTGRCKTDEIAEIPCSCPSCKKLHGKPSEMGFKQILDHNYYALINEVKQVRNAIVSGCLRELVETRVRTYPILTAMLRNLDFKHYGFLEERTSLIRSSQLIATSKESLYRPEVKRFQERVVERYRKPSSTKILLLLPCSAKKPYSFSKSHKLFRERLFCSGNPYVVHEVIITSPLGVVPRELELTYPASLYDIPVTGFWEEDEKKMIKELLTRYLRINKYNTIIVHLSDAIRDFIEDIVKNSVNTCVDNKPTSKESLENLLNVLRKTTGSYERIKPSIRLRENVESFASYQFGRKNAEKLLNECNIKGRYPNHKIMYNTRQLGMITQQRGLISLTLEGTKRIVDSEDYWVEIYDDFQLKGSVFAPGVKDADTSIRIGEEVIVLKNNELCAVGVAKMNGNEMKESRHGEAVKIRHRK